ncbi:MAG: CpsD/CapB family tyrosine-protein kinase [Actinobacteria bacterium]|nr:CpsD/CapB family tyrosine-protein kinase [Actinomycetota bacterium]
MADWGDRETTRVVALEAPRSQAAEAYRTLRTNVLAAAAEHGLQPLAVVSALSGEGKTTTTANLGVVLAQADKRVLVISADMRRPRIHEYFGLEQEEGLSEFLEGMGRPWDSLKRSAIENLWVMASGSVPERPAELLQSATMRELLEEQRRVVDFVLIDCPPVLAVADSLELAPLTDGVIFVADASRTPRGAVIEACAQLDQVGARVIGGILNNVGTGTAGFEYYQKYSYEPLDAPEASSNGKVNLWDTLRKIRS